VVKTQIVGGKGDKKSVGVTEEGELSVVVHPHPPIDGCVKFPIPVREFFVNTSSCCSNDMRVDGSTNNVFFDIVADTEKDIYIKSISVEITDANAGLSDFADLCALTNGVLFEWITTDLGTTTIHCGIKTNWDFIRLAGGEPAFGNTTNAFRANNVSATAEGYIPFINFERIFGLPWGMRLRKGTNDKLRFTVRDNLGTGITTFNIIGYGTKI
jgi:hypothetical protein